MCCSWYVLSKMHRFNISTDRSKNPRFSTQFAHYNTRRALIFWGRTASIQLGAEYVFDAWNTKLNSPRIVTGRGGNVLKPVMRDMPLHERRHEQHDMYALSTSMPPWIEYCICLHVCSYILLFCGRVCWHSSTNWWIAMNLIIDKIYLLYNVYSRKVYILIIPVTRTGGTCTRNASKSRYQRYRCSEYHINYVAHSSEYQQII